MAGCNMCRDLLSQISMSHIPYLTLSVLTLSDLIPQPLHDLKDSGANEGVPVREIQDLVHVFAIGVWIFPACGWTIPVHGAMIFMIKKWAGSRFQNVILILIHLQKFFYEIARFHPQPFRHALNVLLVKDGGSGLAAVGASKAIQLFKNLFMRLVKKIIQVSWRFSFDLQEQLLVFLLNPGRAISEFFQQVH